MAYYENVFLVRPDVSTQQVEGLAAQFSEIVTAQGGKVTKTEHWGLRNLTYRIKKNRKAHYVMFNIDAPPAAIAEMERNMRLSEDVLRTMTVRVDELEEGPSAMLQNKGRDDGGRGGRRERRGRDFGDDRRDFDSRDGYEGGREAEEPAAAAEGDEA